MLGPIWAPSFSSAVREGHSQDLSEADSGISRSPEGEYHAHNIHGDPLLNILSPRISGFSPWLWEVSEGWWIRGGKAGSQDSWVLSLDLGRVGVMLWTLS